jgi:ubiquilin
MLQQVLRNPEMRRMMFSPEMMRMQLQMQRNMGNSGPSFPAPGATDNTTQPGSTAAGAGTTATPNQPNTTGPANPFAAFGGAGAGAGANPFASLFTGNQNPAAPQQQGATQNTQDASGTFPNLFGGAGAQGGQANPFAAAAQRMMQDPEAMRNMMQMMGGAGGAGADPFAAFGQGAAGAPGGGAGQQAGANPFAALFGPGGFGGAGGFGAPAPADNRPPEEIYETQLRQLNEMGFYEFDRNVAALRRSGGNVQGAIEHLLNGGA